MNEELVLLIETFQKILQVYSVIERKPKDFGTGDLLYVSELHTIAKIGQHPEINITQLADATGVTKGAVSQIVKRLLKKNFIEKCKSRNRKEVNLQLSEKGNLIYREHETFEKEIFGFAEKLYNEANPAERKVALRLFNAIYLNTRKIMEDFLDTKQ
jgi:DNA-binding MarR family transcriptional regulator